MKLLDGIDQGLREGALHIARTLSEAGHQVLFAGGVVRDLLLQRPVGDVDIATSATPDEVEALFSGTLEVGREFGVMLVPAAGRHFEVATFRSDAGYRDGRRPVAVRFTDAATDARRRDFTINALFLDPFEQEVIDYVDGRSDLDARLVRTVGSAPERFAEDKLRLLRAVRFACQLDFEIEAATLAELKRRSGEVTDVSWERIREELLKILTGPVPVRGFDLLDETGILAVVLPEVDALKGVEQPPEFHPEGDVFVHTRLLLQHARPPLSPTLALAVLLHDVGKPATFQIRERIRFDGHAPLGAEMSEQICRRLRLSNDDTHQVVELVRQHLRFMHVRDMRESTLKRFLRQDGFDEHLELHRLDCLASHGDLTNYEFCARRLEEFGREQIRPDPLIDGHDLIEMGLTPGPLFGEILRAVEDLQLEGELSDREAALEWVRSRHPAPR